MAEINGGPAFPCPMSEQSHANQDCGPYQGGMTLRDYFIAHAPAEPQQWFRPAMPHPCPQPPASITDKTEEEREDHAGYMDDMLNVGDVRSNRLAAHLREYEAWRTWKRAWDQDHAKQSYVQWPAAWADEMLKARSA